MKTGDVVQLKSGGPEMTVKGIIGDANNPLSKTDEAGLRMAGHQTGEVYCQWFDDKKELRHAAFKQEVLDVDDGDEI